MPPGWMPDVRSLAVMLVFGAAAIVMEWVHGTSDLLPTWLASMSVAEGRPDLLYPPAAGVFTISPPEGWADLARRAGHDGPVYPYLYPPLWPWLLAPLTRVVPFQSFAFAAGLVNLLSVCLMLLAARNLAAPRMSQPLYLAIGLFALSQSTVGLLAFEQNQPHILVACLTVLAIERAERDAPVAAGVLMGLAAALKVYPALLALVWLAQGRWRAVAAFAAAGGALGLASIAVAGWPAHRQFLDLLEGISSTAVITNYTYSLAPAFGQLFLSDSYRWVDEVLTSGTGGRWLVAPLPDWAVLAQKIAMAAVALAGGLMLRRSAASARAALWPALLCLVAIVSPLSWSYHYLAPFAFLPMLADRFGALRGGLAIAAAVALTSRIPLVWLRDRFDAALGLYTIPLAGLAMALLLAAAFLAASRVPCPRPALRPEPSGL